MENDDEGDEDSEDEEKPQIHQKIQILKLLLMLFKKQSSLFPHENFEEKVTVNQVLQKLRG